MGVFAASILATASSQHDGASTTPHRQPVKNAADSTKTHELVHRNLSEQNGDGTVNVWVFMTDKGLTTARGHQEALAKVASEYDPHAIERRQNRRTRPGLFDYDDLPVHDSYVDATRATGAQVCVTSQWLNSVSVRAKGPQIVELAALPFVKSIQLVREAHRVVPDNPARTTSEPVHPGSVSAARQRSLFMR
jgi:hypothetical protein